MIPRSIVYSEFGAFVSFTVSVIKVSVSQPLIGACVHHMVHLLQTVNPSVTDPLDPCELL